MKNTKEKIAIIAILANALLATSKIIVGIFSNSASILANGIDSSVDIVSSGISYLGIKIAKKPADAKHPYGHYKFEVLSGALITIIVFLTGIGIIYEAIKNFSTPAVIKISYLTFGVMIISALINEIMARLKIYYGKKENSVALLSDGTHSRVDVYASLAVLAGLFLSNYWEKADAVLALLMGLYILKGAFSIGKEAIGSLLDISAGDEIEKQIKAIAQNQNIEITTLKTQKKGSAITANIEIKLPSDLSVEIAEKKSETLKNSLVKEVKNLEYIAVQIKSYEIETGFFKPEIGRSFNWKRKGRFIKENKEAEGKGPGGDCVCEKCGYRIKHQKRTPCSSLKCPKCQIPLSRKNP